MKKKKRRFRSFLFCKPKKVKSGIYFFQDKIKTPNGIQGVSYGVLISDLKVK